MSRPAIDHPTFEVTIPSSQQKVRIRAMRVKEEKILLTAKEGDSPNETWVAVKNVVQNCIVGDLDVSKLALFDLDYLFIKVRGASMGNKIDLTFTDREDVIGVDENGVSKYKEHALKVDLEGMVIKWPDNKDLVINMSAMAGLQLRYPTVDVYESKSFSSKDSKEQDIFDELLLSSLVKYFDGEKVFLFKDMTPTEVKDFIDDLDIGTYGKLREFIGNLPTVYEEVPYKNSKGEDKSLKLSSLTDFFAFA